MFAYLPLFISGLSLLTVLLLAVRREVREDGMTPAQRLKKLEAKAADHDQLHTGQTQAREELAKDLSRDMQALKDDTNRRVQVLEADGKQVQGLRERMVRIETELQSLPRIEASVKQMNELLMKFLTEK